VRKSIKQIDKIDDMENQGVFKQMSKKEVLDKNRERSKLLNVFAGIREMSQLPGVIVITDLNHEHIAVSEARRLRIPIIGICDTNVNPELVQYPIPANDDALRSVSLIVDYLAANAVQRHNPSASPNNAREQAAEKPAEEKV
jgi:small subunit ribosomal protein S2